MNHHVVAKFVVGGLIAVSAGSVCAQSYPTKPVRIVADTAGGGTDFVARMIAQPLTTRLGQQVVVDNRGGASGDIGIGHAARSAADGYTLLVWSNGMWTLPFLRKASFDPIKDFTAITLAVTSPNVLVVHPSLPVKSVKQLISLAKEKPGQLSYASGGPGTTSSVAAELFKAAAGVNMLDVPYKGAAPGVTALLGGEVQVMFPIASGIVPHINARKVRALGVTTAEPTALFPDLPTIAASGLPGFQTTVMYGVFAPTGTPAPIIKRLNEEIVALLNTADVKQRFFKNGTEVVGSSPDAAAATIKSEMARVGKVIKGTGMRSN